MPARKVAKKTAKKGGTLDADLTSIAVPFGLLLAKQSLEKLSGTKVKATKGKKVVKNVAKAKTAKRMKRVAVGGNNTVSNGIGNAVNVVNTGNVVNASGVNSSVTGGKSVKKGRGRPRSRVGGNNVSGVTNSTLGSGNVSGGRGRKSTKSKKGGKTTPKKTRKTQKGGSGQQEIDQKIERIAREILDKINLSNNATINTAIETAFSAIETTNPDDKKFMIEYKNDIKNKVEELRATKAKAQAQAQAARVAQPQPAGGGKSKAKRGRGRPRKN